MYDIIELSPWDRLLKKIVSFIICFSEKKDNEPGENCMDIIVRLEEEKDYRRVEEITRAAFYYPERISRGQIGCPYEHWMVHELRHRDGIAGLSLVAQLKNGAIVGHIICSNAVVRKENQVLPVLNFGPLSVLPEYQRQGVGKALVQEMITRAEKLDYGAILFFGRPEYYPQFGFQEAAAYGISDCEGYNYPAFMAMELKEGYLKDMRGGKFYESDIYNDEWNRETVREFDRKFVAEKQELHVHFETERLIVRQYILSDLDALSQIMSDSRVHTYTKDKNNPWDRQRTEKYVRFMMEKDFKTLDCFHGAVVEKATNQLIGLCGLNPYKEDEPEIEFKLGVPYWGKGYATELGRQMIKEVFASTDIRGIYGMAEPENTASRKVLEKIGMEYLGNQLFRGHEDAFYHVRRQHISYDMNGHPECHIVMDIN